MSRAYEQLPNRNKRQKYLCPWKIFANPNLEIGKNKTPITINDNSSARDIYRTLEAQNKYCKEWCKIKSCRLACRKAVVDVFSPGQPSKPGSENDNKGVTYENELQIGDNNNRKKTIMDWNART